MIRPYLELRENSRLSITNHFVRAKFKPPDI